MEIPNRENNERTNWLVQERTSIMPEIIEKKALIC
jgi:hypothetical protein